MQRRSFLLSGMLLGVAALGTAAAQERAAGFDVDGHIALRAYQGLVEEHLVGVLRTLKALAATSDAQTMSWQLIKPALLRLSQDLTTDATVWYALPDGRYHSTDGDTSTKTLADRDYFPKLLARSDVIGSLVISKSTGHRSIIVATPVFKEGHVVGALGVSLQSRLISQLVTERTALPDNLTFYALDTRGQAAIHKDPNKMFQFPSDLGEPSLKSAVTAMLSQTSGVVQYRFEGKDRSAVFNKSDVTGWRFVLVQISS